MTAERREAIKADIAALIEEHSISGEGELWAIHLFTLRPQGRPDRAVEISLAELLGLLERDERLNFDVAPLLADIASDPAVAAVGHSRSAEIRVIVDMSDYSKEARRRLYEKHRVWLLKMPAGLSLDLNLADATPGDPQ